MKQPFHNSADTDQSEMDTKSVSPRRLIHRRTAITRVAVSVATATGLGKSALGNDDPKPTGLGLVIYDCNIRRKWLQQQQPGVDLFEPLTFLRHCRALGAGGMQARLGVMTPSKIAALRDFAEQHGMYIEAIISSPSDGEIERFESEIKTARDVGARAARTTIIPGRRYERFDSFEQFQEFQKRGHRMLERAVPIVEKHRIPFAVENHKDERIDERVALLSLISSEFVGACVDTGNSFALLNDPYEAVDALAPFAMSVHLKDQAVLPYADGFLLGDIPLGQGCFDLARMVKSQRRVRPDVRYSLELITRDALRVPCLTDSYYRTLPAIPARDLARTLRFVGRNAADKLQHVSDLSLEEQVKLEDANVAASLDFAREILGL